MRIADLDGTAMRALNSATQYPSILTYHALGERGRLTENRTVDFTGDDVLVSEKLDGTNSRVIVPPAGCGNLLIGSRTELLHYLGDRIHNPAQGIVETVLAEVRLTAVADLFRRPDALVVLFGEVYGGKVSSGSKQYSSSGVTGFRLFDIAVVPVDVLDWAPERVSAWREHGGQRFETIRGQQPVAERGVPDPERAAGLCRVPYLSAEVPPAGPAETLEWLSSQVPESRARLDDGGGGRPEGVVVRTPDRSKIAKIRFEDYQRTLRAQSGKGAGKR
jgi:hypothetical protein